MQTTLFVAQVSRIFLTTSNISKIVKIGTVTRRLAQRGLYIYTVEELASVNGTILAVTALQTDDVIFSIICLCIALFDAVNYMIYP